jgi:hypothetical protein
MSSSEAAFCSIESFIESAGLSSQRLRQQLFFMTAAIIESAGLNSQHLCQKLLYDSCNKTTA